MPNWPRHILIALMSILFLTKEHSLNLRYVSVLTVPFYLMSGLGLWHIILLTKKIFKNSLFNIFIAVIFGVFIIISISDYQNFKRIIVKSGIKDLSFQLLKESSHATFR